MNTVQIIVAVCIGITVLAAIVVVLMLKREEDDEFYKAP